MLSAVLWEWRRDIYEHLLQVTPMPVLYKHYLIFKKKFVLKTTSNLPKNWNNSTITLRDFVQISLAFLMTPFEAKGPNPGSHTVLASPDCLIPFHLEPFLSLFLTFTTLTCLQVTGETLCGMSTSVGVPNVFPRSDSNDALWAGTTQKSGCIRLTVPCWWYITFIRPFTDKLTLNKLYFLITTGIYIPF